MGSVGWILTVQVAGSPALSIVNAPMDIEAIDRIEATIAPGDKDKVVEAQPSSLKAVRLLLVTCSSYSEHLSFKVSDGTNNSDAIVLDGPQLFSGGGVALLHVDPKQLKFSNSGDKPAKVEICIARDATP